jgi:copper(I)-binding protein
MKTLAITLTALLTVSALMLSGAACNDSDSESSDEIQVSDVFARAALDRGGVYMIIENNGDEDDALISARAEIALETELHQTITEGAEVRMEPVEAIDVPAGEMTELKPSGFHVMLMDLDQPIEPGDEVALTLTFENAGEMQVMATGREYGDMPGMGSDGGMGN